MFGKICFSKKIIALPSMRLKVLFMVFALVPFTAGASDLNLIDATYGNGAGSFELGGFVNNGAGFMSLYPGNTIMTGWTSGLPGGVDWLSAPTFGVQSGLHAVDLIGSLGLDGSLSTVLSTTIGQTYDLSFYTATVATGNFPGLVSAGSLVGQSFTAPISQAFTNQVFEPYSFLFTATGSTTTVTFTASAINACNPDCYGPVIDNVSVSSVPVPSAIWLFGSALVGFIGFNRSKTIQQ